jgi:hypothetical protein
MKGCRLGSSYAHASVYLNNQYLNPITVGAQKFRLRAHAFVRYPCMTL